MGAEHKAEPGAGKASVTGFTPRSDPFLTFFFVFAFLFNDYPENSVFTVWVKDVDFTDGEGLEKKAEQKAQVD